MDTSPSGWARLRRYTLALAVALLAVYALYLVAGNVFLRSDLARELVGRKPGTFRMDWSSAHTLWPGRVTLGDVRMQGQARRTQWSAQAGQVRGRIALWPLLRREVRVPWLEAEAVTGTVARVDEELPRPTGAVSRVDVELPRPVDAVAPVDVELPRPTGAVARAGVELARAEPHASGWTLRMDRIASDSVTGADLFGWHITGKGRAEVGFSKQFRGGSLELFPSMAHFESASVQRDGGQWLGDARIDAGFALAPHLSSAHPGLGKLPLLSATLDLQASTVALQAVLGEDGHYRFDAVPGIGRLEAKLALDDGALREGDRLRVHAPLRFVDAQGTAHDSALDLTLDVDQSLHLRAQVPQQPGHDTWLAADLRMPGTALPLQDARQRLMQSTSTARGRWHVPSLGGLLALFTQADWLALDGSGTVEADLQLADGRLATGSRLHVREVEARADVLGNRFSGRARADAVIEAGEDGVPRSRVSLAMERFDAAPGSTPQRPWVYGNDLRVDVESDAQLDRMRESLQARVRFQNASVPELAMFNPYLPNDRVRFAGGSGRLSGDLRVNGEGEVGEGTLRVDARKARLSVAGLALDGDVVIDGRLRRGSLQQGNFHLGGTQLRLRNVGFRERGGHARRGWWATVDLQDGHVAWRQPATAGGKLRARMKDLDFLLAMFADRADYPAWIGRVVDAGEVSLDGRWLWQGDKLVLDRMHAANQRFQVDARMRLQGQRRQGDLYARWGVLGVGVELTGERPKLHLRNAREWYDGRPHLLP
ncbi:MULTISPECIES: hypothetical protein [unclassified Luteimonas]